jgi:hypothetical protein
MASRKEIDDKYFEWPETSTLTQAFSVAKKIHRWIEIEISTAVEIGMNYLNLIMVAGIGTDPATWRASFDAHTYGAWYDCLDSLHFAGEGKTPEEAIMNAANKARDVIIAYQSELRSQIHEQVER